MSCLKRATGEMTTTGFDSPREGFSDPEIFEIGAVTCGFKQSSYKKTNRSFAMNSAFCQIGIFVSPWGLTFHGLQSRNQSRQLNSKPYIHHQMTH